MDRTGILAIRQGGGLLNFLTSLFLILVLFLGTSASAAIADTEAPEASVPAVGINLIGGPIQVIEKPWQASRLLPQDEVTAYLQSLGEQSTPRSEFTQGFLSYGFSDETAIQQVIVSAHPQAHEPDYVLLIDYALLDELRVYTLTGDQLTLRHHTGDRAPFSTRPLPHRSFAIPIRLLPGETLHLVLQAQSTDTLQLPIRLYTQAAFADFTRVENHVFGFYFGGMASMFLFFAILSLHTRDKALMYFSLFLLSTSVVGATLNGVVSQFLPEVDPLWIKWARVFALLSGALSIVLFAREFLVIREQSPGFHRVINGVLGVCLTVFLISLVAPFTYAIQLTLAVCSLSVALIIAAGLFVASKGYPPARFYVLGWVVFFVGSLTNIARAFSLVPNNFITEYGVWMGAQLCTISLALGIAVKFNHERLLLLKMEQWVSKEKEERLHAQLKAQEDRYLAERAEAEARAASEFLASMSHEIRTPMNGVLGITQLLKDTALDAQQKEYVNTLAASGEALLGVINDILDYSKIEAGKVQVEQISLDPVQLTRDAMKLLSTQAMARGISLSLDLEPGLPDRIASDPTRIYQVLLNLMSNALKFTHEGSVTVRIERVPEAEHLRFSVIDTGIGLSEEQQRQLFRSFSQADRTTTRKYGGTGLGLYISKRLTELMGGQIGVTSQLGQGACFWFTVATHPELLDRTHPLETDREDEAGSDIGVSGLSVLVAEDNPTNQLVIKGLLGKLGISPTIVANGVQCCEQILAKPEWYDCVLMDCEMPEMDGYEATRTIRAIKELRQPVIIGLSANALAEQEKAALDAGMDAYLRKPIKLTTLNEALRRVKRARPHASREA